MIGVYEDGRVWTDIKALGPERAAIFSRELLSAGTVIDTGKAWCFWQGTDGRVFELTSACVDVVAHAVATVATP